jgi:hypothetical protein
VMKQLISLYDMAVALLAVFIVLLLLATALNSFTIFNASLVVLVVFLMVGFIGILRSIATSESRTED